MHPRSQWHLDVRSAAALKRSAESMCGPDGRPRISPVATRSRSTGHFVGDGFALQDPESWAHKPFDLTVKAVCSSCNNGWMARLESDAKEAVFSSAFAGRGRSLHRGGQRTLAAWALKTAMMVEQTNAPTQRGIPRAEYEYLQARR